MSSARSTLQSRFLDSLTEEKRQRVFMLTRELSEVLDVWARKYPQIMRAVRVPQICLTMAASSPFLEVHELLPAARMSLWVFAVDDLCDRGPGETYDLPEALRWAHLERSVSLLEAPERADVGDDPLLLAMRDMEEELTGFPLARAVRPHLVASLREMMRSMRLEAEWSLLYRESPRAPHPSLHDYLERAARHSIGTLPIYLCVLSTMQDGAFLSRLPQLVELGYEAALGLRLANDLQGYERELLEGKLNSLVILQREFLTREGLTPEDALARARAEVKARAMSVVARCMASGGEAGAVSTWPERVLLNALAFAFDFYAHHDYHDEVVREDGQGLDASGSSAAHPS